MPDNRPTVVIDPDDDPALSDELHRRADVAAGVVVARPVPGVAGPRQLVVDLLIALGKHFDALTRERQGRHGLDLVDLWLRAERVRHLVVLDADLLPATLVTLLTDISERRAVRLWLVSRGGVVSPWRSRVGGRCDTCDPQDLLGQLPVRDQPTTALLDAGVVLPQEDFLTFRAACKRLLGEAVFGAVDAVYVDAHRATRDWLACRRWRERPDRDEIARQLRELIRPSSTAAEVTIRLRAAQAAYFVDGAVVQLAPAHPRGIADVGVAGLNRRTADRLRRLVTPAWACALAFTIAGGFHASELTSLTLQQVDGDGAEVVVGDQHVDLPAYAAGLVRAQVLARRDQAAADNKALLITAKGAPFDRLVLQRQIDRAAQLAAIWSPQSQQSPAWHAPPVSGHNVTVLPLRPNWEAVSR